MATMSDMYDDFVIGVIYIIAAIAQLCGAGIVEGKPVCCPHHGNRLQETTITIKYDHLNGEPEKRETILRCKDFHCEKREWIQVEKTDLWIERRRRCLYE